MVVSDDDGQKLVVETLRGELQAQARLHARSIHEMRM